MRKDPIRSRFELPSDHDWRTTDADEVNRRRYRAHTQSFRIKNQDGDYPIFSNFEVHSKSGLQYLVEIRSVSQRRFSCTCVDFRINGLGTCKHVEAVLLHLEARHPKLFRQAQQNGSGRIDIVPDPMTGTLRIEGEVPALPRPLNRLLADGISGAADDCKEALATVRQAEYPGIRISQEVESWLEALRHEEERLLLRRAYEQKVQSGEWPSQETLVPLYPYQREGMLHLAFQERALLADEMGLGKTIQAIAACALLHRMGKARRVLVVTPASLKTEWEDQIQRFTPLQYQLVFGLRHRRLTAYEQAPFFTIVNYEQMIRDALDVNQRLRPDVVILDEAQRIKNWSTKTAQAVKRLSSRYAFVLTGTPIENRIDEIYSIMGFLDPAALGPLFRFNRDFYEFDERGRPSGYRNLDRLHERIRPYMLRRRKADVETELPERTDRNFFVPMSAEQRNAYDAHEATVARLAAIAKRRPLTQQESEKLMRELAMMRMLCDTTYILDPHDRSCPKMGELEKLLDEMKQNPDVKAVVFSEWERMLELVREKCDRMDLGYAYHTGTVPQRRRRAEIMMFKSDPECRVFLSTDSGGTGLNLQSASIVVNCDLPWNPARLEQRIARAWRKHQTRPVTVINLVSENTIEHRMIGTLASKQALADGVLDLRGDLKEIKFRGGRQAFLSRLEQLMGTRPRVGPEAAPEKKKLPVDRSLAFSRRAAEELGAALVRCEERYPLEGSHSVLVAVVERDAPLWLGKLQSLHQEYFPSDESDPLAPVRLEVIDRATDEAMQRLKEMGLVSVTIRATRHLHPDETRAAAPAPLSEAEKEKAAAHRAQAARKLKMARLLIEGDLADEARESLMACALWAGRALSVEKRLPEPKDLEEMLRPPLSLCWGDNAGTLRGFAENAAADPRPILELLDRSLSLTPGP